MATKQGYYLSHYSAESLAKDAKRWHRLMFRDDNPDRCKSAYVRWMVAQMSEFLDVVEKRGRHPADVWREILK